ncbi:MAG: hypothetical protein HQK51_10910 [Oligoflexia bacterium]|nr:hypothetical protein [Oligoflexia bacterium]
MKKNFLTIVSIIITFFPFLVIIWPVISDNTNLLGHDSYSFHFKNFFYYASSLKYDNAIPRWYPGDGGIPAAMTIVPYFSLHSYKLLAHFLNFLLEINIVLANKLNLLIGIFIIILGCWHFIYDLSKSKVATVFSCWLLLLGGFGTTIFHQEQVIPTLLYIPWLALSILRFFRSQNCIYLLPISLFTGMSFISNYPHIFAISIVNLLIALLIFYHKEIIPQAKIICRIIFAKKNIPYLFAATVLFLMSVCPLVYVFFKQGSFGNMLRETAYLNSKMSYENYLHNNLQIINSSAPLEYFLNFLYPWIKMPELKELALIGDSSAFYITSTGLLFSFFSLFVRKKHIFFLALFAFLSFLSTIGINGPIPFVFFHLYFPTIEIFRQWYHFFPYLNFTLALMAALAASRVLVVAKKKSAGHKLLLHTLLLFSLTYTIFESANHFHYYANKLLIHKEVIKDNKENFYGSLKISAIIPFYNAYLGTFNEMGRSKLFVSKDREYLYRKCPGIRNFLPLFTDTLFTNQQLANHDCYPNQSKPYIINLLADDDPRIIKKILTEKNLVSINIYEQYDKTKTYREDIKAYSEVYKEMQVSSQGISLYMFFPYDGILALPFSFHSIGEVSVDDHKESKFSFNRGAITALFLKRGIHNISLKAADGINSLIIYLYSFCSTLSLLMMISICFTSFTPHFSSAKRREGF